MEQSNEKPKDIAITGMACIFPKAPDLTAYWRNILQGVCAVTEARPEHWDTSVYFDPDSGSQDRVYCKHGGFLSESERRFRPLDFGVPPRSVPGGEPDHFLALGVAYEALSDAGYLQNEETLDRTGIILGRGNYVNAGNMSLLQHGWVVEQTLKILRRLHPEYTQDELQDIKAELKASLPPLQTDVIPSLIPNVMTGRIANRLNITGPNYTIDGACASSLLSVDVAVQELRNDRCDLALVGGVQGGNTLLSYLIFCSLGAMSRSGTIRAFDKDADGTVLGEGIGIVVLKRRADAERDGDHIYSLIKGTGTSSDGKGAALLTPQPRGAALALRRAYEDAQVGPETIELLEAHGTGTPVGDTIEIQAIQEIFGQRRDLFPPCAIGSVKSMLGHLIPASGAAGLIKATLALYHKVIPATLHCDDPNPALDQEKGFFYVNTRTRPWVHGKEDYPRRAGVSALGFGGINAHVVLEEYPEDKGTHEEHLLEWDSELLLIEREGRAALLESLDLLSTYVRACPKVELRHLAYSLFKQCSFRSPLLALVVHSKEDLSEKLSKAAEALRDPQRRKIKDRKGIYYFEEPLDTESKLAFLFPGEGSQYPDMLRDLSIHFPSVRRCFDEADRSFHKRGKPYVPSDAIFPRPWFREEDRAACENLLWQMDVAIESVQTANEALYRLLSDLGLEPHVMLGHSSGEYFTMLASGMVEGITEELVIETNRVVETMEEKGEVPEAMMIAAGTDRSRVESTLEAAGCESLFLAMDNCPHQVILVGPKDQGHKAMAALKAQSILCELLPFQRAYHTPLFQSVADRLREVFSKYPISKPRVPVWSSTRKGPYPDDPEAVRDLMAEHWVQPVAFRETIENLYQDGYRIFVEVGPRGNLTSFVQDTLQGRPHLAVPADLPRKPGLEQMHHMLGLLGAQRIKLDLLPLYRGRGTRELTLDAEKDSMLFAEKEGTLTLSMGLPQMDIPQRGPSPMAAPANKETPGPSDRSPEAQHRDPREGHKIFPDLPQDPLLPVAGSGQDEREGHEPPFSEDHALGHYFQNMERFLEIQREVMEGFLHNDATTHLSSSDTDLETKPAQTPSACVDDLPLLGKIVYQDQDSIRCARTFSFSEDLYLEDHVLAGQISALDPHQKGLAVVPLTISMEMMAEVASRLVPNLLLVGMHEVRTYRWMPVNEQAFSVEIEARKTRAGATFQEVEVEVRDTNTRASEMSDRNSRILTGTLRFSERYPSPPAAKSFTLEGERPSKWTKDRLYPEGMFHGPRFQAVTSVNLWGQDGTTATFRVSPLDHLFKSVSRPRFCSDPVILDAAGQLIGYWTAEHLDEGFMVFPYRCEELILYGPLQNTDTPVTCRARTRLFGVNQVRSDLEIVTPDDRIWMTIRGWEDKRFDLPERFYRFWKEPMTQELSQTWQPQIRASGIPAPSVCRCLDDPLESADGIWKDIWAHIVLRPAEREEYRSLEGQETRQMDWLLGRTVAKEAFRRLIREEYGVHLGPADVELITEAAEPPRFGGPWREEPRLKGIRPSVTLAHSNGRAVAWAVCSEEDHGVGIELEGLPGPGQEGDTFAFSDREKKILEAIPRSEREEWELRFRCCKGSIAKALRTGQFNGLRGIEIVQTDREQGTLVAHIETSRESEEPKGGAQGPITVYTSREQDWIVAWTLIPTQQEPGGNL